MSEEDTGVPAGRDRDANQPDYGVVGEPAELVKQLSLNPFTED